MKFEPNTREKVGGHVIIMGHWDGQPIWRFATLQERFEIELAKYKKPYSIKIKING